MAYDNARYTLPGISAGADLTAAQHRFVSIDATGRAVLTAAGARVDGVVDNKPNLDEAAAVLGYGSVAKVEASAAIAAGASVASAANGQAVTATLNAFIAGVCVEAAGAAGELCSIYLASHGQSP